MIEPLTVHVIGALGVVGSATANGIERFGHEVIRTDKGDDPVAPAADIKMICVPEDAVPSIVRALKDTISVVVIRSSVPPGTTEALAQELHRDVFHNPEFLRAGVAEYEFLESQHAIVGMSSNWGVSGKNLLDQLYSDMGKTLVFCTSTESELLKLAMNCYLATQIAFWVNIGFVAKPLGVQSHRIARLALLDKRVSPYGAVMSGTYGGACLPKDMAQMLRLARSLPSSVSMPVVEGVQVTNRLLGGE